MEILRRKPEQMEVIRVRVPAVLKRQLVEQRRRAERMGFNYTATLVEVLAEAAHVIEEELTEKELHAGAMVEANVVRGAGKAGLRLVSDGRRRRDH
jgi:hypothetical protein